MANELEKTNDNTLSNLKDIPSTVGNYIPSELPFTPRVQILTSTSKVVKDWKTEDSGPMPEMGVFWLGPPGGRSLGKRFLAIPIATRPHALQVKKGDVTKESYKCANKGSPPKDLDEKIYAEIAALPKQQPKEGIFNYYGGDALLWIPQQPHEQGSIAVGTFAIYFLNSTARPEIDNCNACKGKLCYVRAHQSHSTQFSWYVPEVGAINDGKFDPNEFPLPDVETMTREVTQFLNPNPKGEGRENSDGVDGRPR